MVSTKPVMLGMVWMNMKEEKFINERSNAI